MPTINIAATSGQVHNSGANYTTVRTALTGNTVAVNPATTTIGQSQIGSTYHIYRGFLAFNTTAITATPASATLNIFLTLVDTAQYILLTASAPTLATNIALADYDAYTNGSSYGSFTAVAGWNTITLNLAARNTMNTNTTFNIAILGVNDSNNIAPTAVSQTDTMGFATNVPYLSYVAGGYGQKPLGLTTANSVDGVLMSAISKINGA